MQYVFLLFILLLIAAMISVSLPVVTKKENMVKIGTISSERYDLHQYHLVVKAEDVHDIQSPAFVRPSPLVRRRNLYRGARFVCIYVYSKSDLHTKPLKIHYIPVGGSQKNALKKEQKIKKILE